MFVSFLNSEYLYRYVLRIRQMYNQFRINDNERMNMSVLRAKKCVPQQKSNNSNFTVSEKNVFVWIFSQLSFFSIHFSYILNL